MRAVDASFFRQDEVMQVTRSQMMKMHGSVFESMNYQQTHGGQISLHGGRSQGALGDEKLLEVSHQLAERRPIGFLRRRLANAAHIAQIGQQFPQGDPVGTPSPGAAMRMKLPHQLFV